MVKNRVRDITIKESRGAFSLFKDKKIAKGDYDFSGILALRRLLTNERARMLDVIKYENPSSIYDLAKKLGRGFKSVQTDIKLLERFGFVELIKQKTKNRIRHKPLISTDSVTINIRF
jgi:predicted transcriptional regulator